VIKWDRGPTSPSVVTTYERKSDTVVNVNAIPMKKVPNTHPHPRDIQPNPHSH